MSKEKIKVIISQEELRGVLLETFPNRKKSAPQYVPFEPNRETTDMCKVLLVDTVAQEPIM